MKKTNERLFEEAKRYFPGGVNSPVRAFKAVGGTPPFMLRGKGSKIYDAEAKGYIDYVLSWGPLILGHAHPAVVAAVRKAAGLGLSFGAPTPGETELAKLIIRFFPSIEKIRFVNSGTEAVMSAIRLARGFTGRDKIIKFQGCYHGHSDYLLVAAGSGATTFGAPDSPGVPAESARNTLNLPYNDLKAVRQLVETEGKNIACILLEPVVGNMGLVLPGEGFLEGLRDLASQHGILLIFDEVMTGFRVSPGGAQAAYRIKPDLTTLGKVMGGGMPIGAYGGRADIMSKISPEGAVYQAGTLSGNPVSVAAGLSTLRELMRPGVFKKAEARTRQLTEGVREILKKKSLPYKGYSAGTMFGLFFTGREVRNYDDAKTSDTRAFARFHAKMLAQGVYLAPSQFEAGFLSSAHTEKDIEKTLDAFSRSL